MAFSWNNDNAAAAANAGRALSGLGNFLYEQQVQKPLLQAQTAQITGETGLIPGQKQLQSLQVQAATKAWIDANPHIDVDAVNAAANGTSQPTDVSTKANALQVNPTAPVTGPAGDGYAGPAPQSSSITTLPNTPAGGIPNQAGSSTQGAQRFNADGSIVEGQTAPPTLSASPELFGKPGGIGPQPPFGKWADRADEIARDANALLTGPNAVQKPTISPAPPTSSTSPIPPIGSPASVSPPAQGGSFDLRNHIGDHISTLAAPARNAILDSMRQPYVTAGLPAPTDQELIGRYTQKQMETIPPLQLNKGWKMLFSQDGKITAVPNDVYEEMRSSKGGNAPLIYDWTTGKQIPNPAYQSPEKIQPVQQDLALLDTVQTMADQAKAAIASNPKVVGPIFGSVAGNATRWVESATGHTANQVGQRNVEQFLSKQFLSNLQDLHVGRVLELEYRAVTGAIPKQTDPPGVWQNYFETKLQPFLDRVKASKQQELQAMTGAPQAALPPVNVAPNVGAPDAMAAPTSVGGLPTLTPAQAKNVPKGTQYMTTDGRVLYR